MSLVLPIAVLAVSMLIVFAEASRQAERISLQSHTPLQQASRILAHRYARGQITAAEYGRMIEILQTKS